MDKMIKPVSVPLALGATGGMVVSVGLAVSMLLSPASHPGTQVVLLGALGTLFLGNLIALMWAYREPKR